MSASKEAKAVGLPSLKFVYEAANIKRRTMNFWYHRNRQLFDVVLKGVASMNTERQP